MLALLIRTLEPPLACRLPCHRKQNVRARTRSRRPKPKSRINKTSYAGVRNFVVYMAWAMVVVFVMQYVVFKRNVLSENNLSNANADQNSPSISSSSPQSLLRGIKNGLGESTVVGSALTPSPQADNLLGASALFSAASDVVVRRGAIPTLQGTAAPYGYSSKPTNVSTLTPTTTNFQNRVILLSSDRPVSASVRGNLAPPSILTKSVVSGNWLTDRWQVQSDLSSFCYHPRWLPSNRTPHSPHHAYRTPLTLYLLSPILSPTQPLHLEYTFFLGGAGHDRQARAGRALGSGRPAACVHGARTRA